MHEADKIAEAERFLERMRQASSRNDFRDHMSAFLTAARTALQYALAEASPKGGQRWYDSRMAGNAILGFFKDERDVNIHEKPVNPSAHFDVRIYDVIGTSDSIAWTIMRADGTIETCGQQPTPPPTLSQPSESSVAVTYHFDDWNGPEDVLSLCAACLVEVRNFVTDGVNLGFLTA